MLALATALVCAGCSSAPPTSDAFTSWTLVNLGDGGTLWDVTVGGPGFIAVGLGASQGLDGAVWTSADGLSWTRVTNDDEALGGEGDQWMNSIVSGGPGFVVVGSENIADFDAAVWTSADGLSWNRVPHDESVFGGDRGQEMNEVVVGGPGLVAVGSDGNRPAVWTSPDGLIWSRVPDQDAFGTDADAFMSGITQGGPGLVAVGQEGEFGSPHAAVWTSIDGVAWSRVPHDGAVFGENDVYSMAAVTAGGSGLVAVGTYSPDFIDSEAAVWSSPNGLAWSRVPHDDRLFGGDGFQSMDHAAPVGSEVLAVGSAGGEEDDAAIWISSNGSDWLVLADDSGVFSGDGYQRMRGVAVSQARIVAVGISNGTAAVWTTPISN